MRTNDVPDLYDRAKPDNRRGICFACCQLMVAYNATADFIRRVGRSKRGAVMYGCSATSADGHSVCASCANQWSGMRGMAGR